MTSLDDAALLERAVTIARRGGGSVSPNPMVGAVIARDGHVIGEGWHRQAGGPHAEVAAIAACAGQDIAGGTIYVSLEPCATHGRTPPCTEAIVRAGIARVVFAAEDPHDPERRGVAMLRAHGVDVDGGPASPYGEQAERARRDNQPFRKQARSTKPWTLFKTATTFDGRVATHTGDSRWISGSDSRVLVHRWRAELDAVACGIGTVLADDPLLTARDTACERQPARVVFDRQARLPLDSALVGSIGEAPVFVVCDVDAPAERVGALTEAGVQTLPVAGGDSGERIDAALDALGRHGMQSMLLEGGPALAGAFATADAIDEIRLFVAPVICGGRAARSPIEGDDLDRLADARRVAFRTVERVGDDVLLTSTLKEW